jgi:hypothetical protein
LFVSTLFDSALAMLAFVARRNTYQCQWHSLAAATNHRFGFTMAIVALVRKVRGG